MKQNSEKLVKCYIYNKNKRLTTITQLYIYKQIKMNFERYTCELKKEKDFLLSLTAIIFFKNINQFATSVTYTLHTRQAKFFMFFNCNIEHYFRLI